MCERDFCVTVGFIQTGSTHTPLIEQWNGSQWTQLAPPNVGSADLNDVSCVSTATCFAVGRGYGTGQLVMHWDGLAWVAVSMPPFALSLTGISCSSANDCVTVGASSSIALVTAVAHFDGIAWTPVPSPNIGAGNNVYTGVSCTSTTSCAIVGSYHDATTSHQQTMIARWDGTATVVSHPQQTASDEDLFDVACTSDEDCVAVGRAGSLTYAPIALVGTGLSPTRSVTVSWDATEDARLLQLSAYLGESPAAVQKTSVYLLGYLIGFLPANPDPQTPPTAGTAASYTSIWEAPEFSVLDRVEAKFALNGANATRLSIALLSFLIGLGGH